MPYEPRYRYATVYDLASDGRGHIRTEKDFWLKLWAGSKELQSALAAQEDKVLLDWVSGVLLTGTVSGFGPLDQREVDAVQHLGYLVERNPGSGGEFLAVVMAAVANRIGEAALHPAHRNWCWGTCPDAGKQPCESGNCLARRTGVGHHHHARAEDVAHAGPGPKKAAARTAKEADKNVLGHGSYSEVDDDVVVPPGVTIHFWTHRDRVLNKIEKARAIITDSAPVDTKGPGETVENLLVSPLKPGEAKESAHATRYLGNHYEVGAGGDVYLCGDSMDGTLKCFFYEGGDGHHPDCQGLLGRKGPLADIITSGGEINFWTCREKGMTTPEETDPRQDYTPEQAEYHADMAAYVQGLLDLRRTNPVLAYLQMASTAHGTRYDLEVVPLDSKEAATHILNRTEPRVDHLSLEPAERAEQIRLIWARLHDLQPWETENLFKREKWIHAYSELSDRRDRAAYASGTFRGLILALQAAGPRSMPAEEMAVGLSRLEAFTSAVESYFAYAPTSEAGRQLTAFGAALRAAAVGDAAAADAVEALDEGLRYLLQPTPTELALGPVDREQPLPW